MLGMHGTVAANYAVDRADLLLAVGVRFDDRVTGKLEAFAARARIVHIDIDPAEINKNKHSHITVCADARPSLQVPPGLECCMCVPAVCQHGVPTKEGILCMCGATVLLCGALCLSPKYSDEMSL